jgi:hypothetical protein
MKTAINKAVSQHCIVISVYLKFRREIESQAFSGTERSRSRIRVYKEAQLSQFTRVNDLLRREYYSRSDRSIKMAEIDGGEMGTLLPPSIHSIETVRLNVMALLVTLSRHHSKHHYSKYTTVHS